MMNKKKYEGIFPAFYACYDDNGEISAQRTKELAKYYVDKGVQGVYVNGSSGECIYQSVEEKKLILESVMEVLKGKLTVIAHVACNNTADSMELARHAEGLGVDAIASIPPIYFKLPPYSIADYWNQISESAPNTDFIIYNIPVLAGVELSEELLKKMLENPRVIGVKNSSMPLLDIIRFRNIGGDNFVVFNGPDEQLAGGLSVGAAGGIGGTYGAMPEVYLGIYHAIKNNNVQKACFLQKEVVKIIDMLCGCKGNMYAVIKEVLRKRENLDIGGVRSPLTNILEADRPLIENCVNHINQLVEKVGDFND